MESSTSVLTNNTKMESRPIIAANAADIDFNVVQFEKRLMQLKDSQESINSLSTWCLEHRQHHKKIVNAWLSVLKKVKVEQRLTLFYLANDVIQYSKRKNYEFVESWGTTLQKATTMVREEKVKNRILRIFKIWEQRGIYGEEFIADLCGLISVSPTTQRLSQDPQDFQAAYLINKIRTCAKLEEETDLKLKILKEGKLKITDTEALFASLKDRRHVEDVEHEVEEGITLIEAYVNALKSEIKSRTHLISILTQADVFYHKERGEVKIVTTAYKNFGTRVKNLKKKLDELIPTLNSPIPSPDINAPSPEPDSDVELPHAETKSMSGVTVYSITETYNAGYYNPAPPSQDDFNNSDFSSFMDSDFNVQNFSSTNDIFSNHHNNFLPVPPPSQDMTHHISTCVQENIPGISSSPKISYNYDPSNRTPLLPPPMPPFTSSGYSETYTDPAYAPSNNTYTNNTSYQQVNSAPYVVSTEVQSSYQPSSDEYNPEEEVETWEQEAVWDPSTLETPESPPMFEKEGFADPIEYDDSKTIHPAIGKDVDLRVRPVSPPNSNEDSNHRLSRSNSKDVDHRNLISLVGGSPINEPSPSILEPPPAPPTLWIDELDQDYRSPSVVHDQDYRVPMDIAQQLKLPPPPPPPPKILLKSPTKKCVVQDNVESIDMDLSDDESNIAQENCGPSSNIIEVNPEPVNNVPVVNVNNHNVSKRGRFYNNKKVNMINTHEMALMEPPPPIPHNLCEIPENNLGNLENECHENMFCPSQAGGPPDMHMNQNGLMLMPPESMIHHMPPMMNDSIMGPGPPPPPMPPICEMPGSMGPPINMNWPGEFFDSHLPPPEFQEFQPNRQFPPPQPQNFMRMQNEFNGGFRGRGAFNESEMFRGRGRGRGMWPRMPRGMNNRGHRGRGRGFRGQFRGNF